MTERSPGANTPAQLFKNTRLIFAGIVSGILLFFFVALVMNQSTGSLAPEINKYAMELKWILAAISFVCMLLAKKIFNKEITIAKDSLIPLMTKLNRYRLALIKYMAICELPALAGIILFMLTGNFVFMIFAAVLLGFIVVMFPSRRRLAESLELDGQQQQELDN